MGESEQEGGGGGGRSQIKRKREKVKRKREKERKQGEAVRKKKEKGSEGEGLRLQMCECSRWRCAARGNPAESFREEELFWSTSTQLTGFPSAIPRSYLCLLRDVQKVVVP